MGSILEKNIREMFYMKLYFDVREGLKSAGIKRAYLDFCRTLHKKNETDMQRKENRKKAEKFLIENLDKIIEMRFSTQVDFDTEHENLTSRLIKEWPILSVGQAQKWINMTLKYWLLFGEKHIHSIEKNAEYFHIPIDSYVQKGMFGDKNPKPWSKIDTYEDYMKYQTKHREKNTGNPPIVDEFNFFNNVK